MINHETPITKPALIVMAAGMGSRYGGLKQIDPVTDQGEIILDFSLYDAMLAGFEEVVFVIKKENEEDFRALVDSRAGKHLNVHYAFQDLTDIPEGFSVPEGREKPWGTGHAVLAARELVAGPFAVINADDYYGSGAFQTMYDFLESAKDGVKYNYAMVGYLLENTLSESGHVARGVCRVSPDGALEDITERTKIMRRPADATAPETTSATVANIAEQNTAATEATSAPEATTAPETFAAPGLDHQSVIAFTEDDGKTWHNLTSGTIVSMNFWGFTPSFMEELKAGFPEFLAASAICDACAEAAPSINLKAEYFLPGVVDKLLKDGKASVKVLQSHDKWYGVTYKEDKPGVTDALQSMKDKGLYPEKLWQ